jgi:hypothetical protein
MYLSPPSRLRRGVIALVVLVATALTPLLTSSGAAPAAAASSPSPGYWMVASDGGIFNYGGARFFGSTGAIKLNMPIVGMAATPSGNGYWLVASDGGIFSFGDAGFFGSTGAIKLNKPIVGMASTPSGKGYWLVASDGGVFAFGDAGFVGSTGSIKLNKPITGMSPSATGHGYRMVATDGGIFSFGDAPFFGSTGGTALAKPISGMAPTPSGKGYWIVGSDGKIFPFGDAAALGSASALHSVAAVAPTSSGAGYWAVGADGALATFGDAADLGHPSGTLTRPIVGMAVLPAAAAGTVGAPTTGVTDPVTGGTLPSTDTTSTTAPQAVSSREFASLPIAGTYGTPPQLIVDPSHPARHICEPWGADAQPNHPCLPANLSNYQYPEEIRSMILVGNRLFIGGFFHHLVDSATPAPGKPGYADAAFLAELDANTGKPIPGSTFAANAHPDLTVEAIAASPDGKRLYIGGRFLNVNGKSAKRIAALDLATGLIDPTFNPPVPNDSVHSIEAVGDRVYIGGSFSDIDGDKRYATVAALNAADGSQIKSFVAPPTFGSLAGRQGQGSNTPGVAYDLVVPAGGQYIVVGGDFLHTGAPSATLYDAHAGLIVLNAADGSLATWRPHNDRPVFELDNSPDGKTIYAAEGGAGGALAVFAVGQDEPTSVNHVDGDALGVAVAGDRVYLGGHFDVGEPNPYDICIHTSPSRCGNSPDHTPHRHLIAYDLSNCRVYAPPPGSNMPVTPPSCMADPKFTAQADTAEGPSHMLAGPNFLYVGGNFKNTLDKYAPDGGKPTFHPGFAMFPTL